MRATDRKFVLVLRPTRLADLETRFGTRMQAAFYVRSLGGDFDDIEREHSAYTKAAEEAKSILASLGRLQVVSRSFLPNFVFGPEDIVVALGQDGLVANTLKYLGGQPLIGVNPDPARYDGRLLPFTVDRLAVAARQTAAGNRPLREVTMARAALNTGLSLLAVNDLFIGVKSHVSARYRIEWRGRAENQSSSGVIVSTGLGSTGWFSSILAGSAGITAAVTGGGSGPGRPLQTAFSWDANHLCFTVREPFPSRTTGASLVFGEITPEEPLVIHSQIGEGGVIFSDGIEHDFVEFGAGTRATITLAERKGLLVA